MAIVAMTREMGSLGKDVAMGIAQRLGRKVVYHEITEPTGQTGGTGTRRTHAPPPARSPLVDRLITDNTSISGFSPGDTMRLFCESSTGVIRGWGAVHMLRGVPHVLRLRICAPLEIRLRRMMDRLATDDRAAILRQIAASEAANSAVAQRHFGVDWRDATHYDLVLSTERLTVEECTDTIERMMTSPRFLETPDSLNLMERVACEWAVRFALRSDARTANANITVRSSGGRIVLMGAVATEAESIAATEVAGTVHGIRDIDNEVTHVAPSRAQR